MTFGLLIIAVFTLAFAMLAGRLSSTPITAPIAFIGLGIVLAESHVVPRQEAETALHLVAEIALIILLFLDAAQINLAELRRHHAWPMRMLTIGLPLSILIGTLAAWPFLPDWPWVAIALVAAILSPTDAALGQAVIKNPAVPERSRHALSVESGLNDGLALPVILLFASLTARAMQQETVDWVLFGASQLVLGPLVGAAVGYAGGTIILIAKDKGLTSRPYEGIGAISLAGAAYLSATMIGGNGFIAAFVAGLLFGHVVKDRCRFVFEFTESEGQLLSWGAFFLIGLILVPEAIRHLDGSGLALILLSLFLVRPLAIWLALIGTDSAPTTRLFFGWFGPRGLATALFALVVVDQIDTALGGPILALAVNAVWISALLHGLSAAPASRWYSAKISAMGECAEIEKLGRPAKPLVDHARFK